jgi:hypothetical protein
MKCPQHPEADAVAYCGHCGRPLCPACRRDVRGVSYCENCLAARLQASAFSPGLGVVSGTGHSPGTALALGFIPGVGSIYNGQILKAIIQVLIFGSLCALGNQNSNGFNVIFGLGAAAFYCYMVIDSYQVAKHKQLGEPIDEWPGGGEINWHGPVVAAILIVLGILFLLDNLGFNVFGEIGRFWPILLIIFGVILLQRKMGGRQVAVPSGAGGGPGSGAAPHPGAGIASNPGTKEL